MSTRAKTPTATRFNTTRVERLSVFYREAGQSDAPKLLLLGGFPASSHQFRNLIPTLVADAAG
jgi:pimeloyl-ACP methyl ester carboxylesterase